MVSLLRFLLCSLLLALLHQTLVFDHPHDDVEVVLGLLVGDRVVEDCAVEVDLRALLGEHPLNSLEHVQDVLWRHAAVVVIVT